MCMSSLAAPGNAVGKLWGDDNLGEQSLGFKAAKNLKADFSPTPAKAAPSPLGPQATVPRAARQGSQLLK
jgi:hypothetical protein